MTIYVVRHGETDLNAKAVCQGSGSDISLNEVGIKQAEKLGENISKFEYIFCSPMKRTKETAHILNKAAGANIIYEPSLIERDYGEFEGLRRCDFEFKDFWNYSLNRKYVKAESIKDLFDRVAKFLEYVKQDYKDKKVLLVTHGGVTRAINAYSTGNYDTDIIINTLPKNCEIREYNI